MQKCVVEDGERRRRRRRRKEEEAGAQGGVSACTETPSAPLRLHKQRADSSDATGLVGTRTVASHGFLRLVSATSSVVFTCM